MKLFTAFIFLLASHIALHGQKDYGFYGHKAIIQLDGLANYPFFSNVLSSQISSEPCYKAKDGKLIETKDRFNVGYRVTIGYAVKRNRALLLEIGQDFSNVSIEDGYVHNNSSDSYVDKHEMPHILTTSFIPKIEFATSKSLLPMGLGHQIGFGVANSSVVKKNYLYETSAYGSSDQTEIHYNDSNADIDPINFQNARQIRKIVFLYALSVRAPLTKNLLLTYGVRYTANIGKNERTDLYESTFQNDNFTGKVVGIVSRHRSVSFINVNLGICYTF
jgi:hypothetical protein